MSYVKQNFSGGQVLTATNLNHMEDGIADVVEKTSKIIDAPVNKFMLMVDGGDLLPGVITPYWTETCSEICAMLRDGYKNNFRFARWVMNKENQNQSLIYDHTAFELYPRENNQEVGARILFGDLQPIVLDAINNKVKFDPNWVAPSEPEKYVMFRSVKGTTTVEAFGTEWLWGMADGSYSGNDLHMEHVVIDNNKGIVINYDKTGYEVTSLVYDNNSNPIQYIVKFYFGDNVCPVIVDLLKQETTLDPDWVAPNTNQQIGIIYNPMMDTYSSTHTYEQLCALGAKLLEVMYYDSAITNDDYPAAVNYMRTLSVKYNRNPANAIGYLEFTFLNHENNGYIVIRVNSNNTIEKQ